MTTIIGELITLMLMAFALGMDAFSIGIGMGMFQLRLKQIFYIGLVVGIFHVWMPMLGMMTGKFLSETFGAFAGYAGGLLLIVLGIQMFMSSFKEEETTLISPVGFGLVLFALSVSLDSFSVGLTLGIFGARTAVALFCFGIAATVLTWAGLFIGRKFQGVLGTYSEALGGSILFAFGIKLLLPL
ncbi:manganese efflux pump MntP family protein [Rossellomorea aquimaris]|jgi:manganese efflux pump family protein|uniref:manganese efflux pump MntP n=1 Tax=Bacillaceae TaxID=186817 RepID=UPI0011EE50AF|nr:manganese efflux pump MntP family protein [Bacillus sp. CH30_1T]KAA0565939.1 manganese efflux pump [Bacillus sp. CH30_1T]